MLSKIFRQINTLKKQLFNNALLQARAKQAVMKVRHSEKDCPPSVAVAPGVCFMLTLAATGGYHITSA